MRVTRYLCTMFCLGMSSASLAADTDFKSPLFIDGIHCEGHADSKLGEALRKNYSNDEIAAVGVKAQLQLLCEALFKEFGVEKFQWVTPGDLERLDFTLKHSKRFQSVDLSIKKSEMQNHVHLVGQFQQFSKKTHYTVNGSSSVERGNADDGNRYTQRLNGHIDFERQGEVNLAPLVFGFDFRNSTAKHPLSVETLKEGGEETTLTLEEQIAQARPSGSYGHVEMRLNLLRLRSYTPFFTIGLDHTRISGDKTFSRTNSYEAGVVFHGDPLLSMNSRTQLSILNANYVATGTETIVPKGQGSGRGARNITFAGLSGAGSSSWMDADFRLYRSITQDLHFFGNVDVLFKLGDYLGLDHGLGVSQEVVRGAVLPEHRLGLPDRNVAKGFWRVGRDFTAFGAKQSLTVDAGFGIYSATNYTENSYSVGNFYGQLAYVTHADLFDVSLAFAYGSQRLY